MQSNGLRMPLTGARQNAEKIEKPAADGAGRARCDRTNSYFPIL